MVNPLSDDGSLSRWKNLIDWLSGDHKRMITSLVVLFVAGVVSTVAVALTKPDIAIGIYDRLSGQDLLAQQRAQEGAEVDRYISRTLLGLRNRLFAQRGVLRAYVFDKNAMEQIIGIVDVFETMDETTRLTGLGQVELPLASINQTAAYMNADRGNPRCIAANAQDYDDPELRRFLSIGGLAASAACPVLGRNGDIIGLIAVSVATPLKENPELEPRTRDTALLLSGLVEQSPKWDAAIGEAHGRLN